MRTCIHRSVLVAATCLGLAGLSTGCGGGSSDADADTFRIGNTGAATFDSPNPFAAVSTQSHAVFRYIYPYLVEYDSDLNLVGAFASDWETSPDGKTWTFQTQPDAKWSDGEPLTAEDAAWTLNTMLEFKDGAAATYAPYLANVKEVTAPSPDTLEVTLSKPTSPLLARLQYLPILPQHVWENEVSGEGGIGLKRFPNEPPIVAGGPFTLESFKNRSLALFTRNENWWGAEPHISSWGLQQYLSPDALVQALKSGEIDLALSLPPTSVTTVEDTPGLSVEKGPGISWYDIGINSNPEKTDQPEIGDPQFRLAFSLAIDREKLIDTFLLGLGTPGVSIIPPSTGRWFNEELEPIPYDPDQANEILDEMGFPKGADGIRTADGQRMSYELIYLGTGTNRLVELITSNLEEVGIELQPKLVGDAAYVPAVTADDYTKFDFSMDYWYAAPDPDQILSSQTCQTLKSFTETAYCSEEYDRLFEEQGATTDDEERKQIVWEMQELLAHDRPYDVLFYQDAIEGWNDEWTGLVFSGTGSFNAFSNESLLNVEPAG